MLLFNRDFTLNRFPMVRRRELKSNLRTDEMKAPIGIFNVYGSGIYVDNIEKWGAIISVDFARIQRCFFPAAFNRLNLHGNTDQ